MTTRAETHAHAATLTTSETVITILTDPCDWQEPVREAARLAADSGRRLKVVLADGGELMAAAALDCVQLVGSRGPVRTIDAKETARLLKAQAARLRRELDVLGRRLGIEVELTTLGREATAFWTGSSALTVFSRRRRGAVLVVHAGTTGTLEVAVRLASTRRLGVRLLAATGEDPQVLARHLERWLEAPPEPLPLDRPLALAGASRIAALVLDPAYVETRKLTSEVLLAELRLLMNA